MTHTSGHAGPKMKRRGLIAGVAAMGMATSARAQKRDPKELRFITAVGLTVLDPIWTASLVTINHA